MYNKKNTFFQAFQHKYSTWKDSLLIFVPFLTMTLVRTLSWSFIFTYLKIYGFVVLGIVLLASLVPMLKFKKDLGYQQILLGTITALFGPCLVGHDFTPFYLITGLVNSFLTIMALLVLTKLVIFDHVVVSHPVALTTDLFHNQTNVLDFSWDEIFIGQHPLFISMSGLMLLWLISFASLVFLHKCLDPVKKFKYSKFFFKGLIYIILFVIFIIVLPILVPIIILALVILLIIVLLSLILDLVFGFWFLCCCGSYCLALCDHEEDVWEDELGFFTRNVWKFFKTQKR